VREAPGAHPGVTCAVQLHLRPSIDDSGVDPERLT
jgi:hypothetical protein